MESVILLTNGLITTEQGGMSLARTLVDNPTVTTLCLLDLTRGTMK